MPLSVISYKSQLLHVAWYLSDIHYPCNLATLQSFIYVYIYPYTKKLYMRRKSRVLATAYIGVISQGANFLERSVLSFSRNFPDLEIHDLNNWKTHVSEILQEDYACTYMSIWMLVIDEVLHSL